MKVVFISRSTLYSAPGGDTVQVINTAQELRKLGLDIDIKLTNEKIEYDKYDLLHFFNIIRPADILCHLKKSKKKFLVSPIYVDYSEYDKQHRNIIFTFLGKIFSNDFTEYLKTLGRAFMSGEKIQSSQYYLWGHRSSILHIIDTAACILPNSESEMKRLTENYSTAKKYVVVPNGINTELFKSKNTNSANKTGVLCVAQIEGRKNQLSLISAINKTALTLTLIGKHSPNQKKYFEKCVSASTNNIKYTGQLDQEKILPYYENAKVHVLASWFETTGLSSLEAAYMGCNIVISDKGDTKEYFGDMAFYCDPSNVDSIKSAVEKAYEAPYNNKLKKNIENNFTWGKAAEKTLQAYKEILNKG